jgi:hypothetical protein
MNQIRIFTRRIAAILFAAQPLTAIVIAIASVLTSCEKSTQVVPILPLQPGGAVVRGAYILCEGLWRQDNSTLSRYDDSTQMVANDFFSRVNTGLRLGDTGNSMAQKGDTLFIAMSVSPRRRPVLTREKKSFATICVESS